MRKEKGTENPFLLEKYLHFCQKYRNYIKIVLHQKSLFIQIFFLSKIRFSVCFFAEKYCTNIPIFQWEHWGCNLYTVRGGISVF